MGRKLWIAVVLLTATAPAQAGELEQALASARASCDLEAAVTSQVVLRTRHSEQPTPDRGLLLARASLLVSELLRMDYEALAEDQRQARLTLGQRIDAAAEEGLEVLAGLPESSEQQRLRADLLATMIRSKLRARKYEKELIAAADRAVELDPANPRALVARAKPLVFADSAHGGDPAAAVELLDRALELEPQLDSALLLRIVALERLGDTDRAAGDRATLTRLRPDCPPPAITRAVEAGLQ